MVEKVFHDFVKGLCFYYERRDPREETLDLWFQQVKHIPDEPVDWMSGQAPRVGDSQAVQDGDDVHRVVRGRAHPCIRVGIEEINSHWLHPFPASLIEQTPNVISQLPDDARSDLVGEDLPFPEDTQKSCADLLIQIVIAEMGTPFPPLFAEVQNRRGKDGEKDNAEVLVLAAMPVLLNQPPEYPVLSAIATLPVVEKDDEGLPVGKWAKVGAIGLKLPVELFEFLGVQLLADAGVRKSHAS
jgi:hypothetical protein